MFINSLIEYLDDINNIPEPATKSPLRRRNKKDNMYKFCGKRDERRKTHGARQARRNDNRENLSHQYSTSNRMLCLLGGRSLSNLI